MNRKVKESFDVVTGASTGIGYELAVQFAQHGYDVLVVAENNDIKNAARRLAACSTQIQDLQVDLARREGVENLWMVAYGSGKILITSFVAATTPGPFQSTYNASKAFLKSFAEAIRNQVKDTNVTTLMPGAIETPFFERAGALDAKVGASKKEDPADGARAGFEALMEDKDHVAASFKNKVQTVMAHMTPDPAVAETHRKQSERGSANR